MSSLEADAGTSTIRSTSRSDPVKKEETEEERKRRRRAEKRRKKLLARKDHGIKYIYNQIDKTEMEKKTEENMKDAEKIIAMETKTGISTPNVETFTCNPNITPRRKTASLTAVAFSEYVRVAVMFLFALLLSVLGDLEPISYLGTLESGALSYFTLLQLCFSLYLEILPRVQGFASDSNNNQPPGLSSLIADNPMVKQMMRDMGMPDTAMAGSNIFSSIKLYAGWGMTILRIIKNWFNDLALVVFVYGVTVALLISYREYIVAELPQGYTLKEEL